MHVCTGFLTDRSLLMSIVSISPFIPLGKNFKFNLKKDILSDKDAKLFCLQNVLKAVIFSLFNERND